MDTFKLLSSDNQDLDALKIGRGASCLATEVEGEVVLLDLDSDVFIGLDEVGSLIWNLLEEPITFATLCQSLRNEYDVPEDTCRVDVLDFLGDLANNSLITLAPESVSS